MPGQPEQPGDIYLRWGAGRCPCCAAGMGPSWSHASHGDDEVQPRAIGEGVLMCGECAYRGHDDQQNVLALLWCIAEKSDEMLDEILTAGRR